VPCQFDQQLVPRERRVTDLGAFIVACGVVAHVDVLAAIVRVESGGNPLALSVNGAVELVRAPRNRDDAAAMARWLASHGHNFDAGLAQVNSANLARLGLDTTTVFEPCPNLRAAASVLDECLARAREHGLAGARAETAALSCYNTGHLTRGITNGYVAAVRRELRRPVQARVTTWATSPAAFLASRRAEVFHARIADAFGTNAVASP